MHYVAKRQRRLEDYREQRCAIINLLMELTPLRIVVLLSYMMDARDNSSRRPKALGSMHSIVASVCFFRWSFVHTSLNYLVVSLSSTRSPLHFEGRLGGIEIAGPQVLSVCMLVCGCAVVHVWHQPHTDNLGRCPLWWSFAPLQFAMGLFLECVLTVDSGI